MIPIIKKPVLPKLKKINIKKCVKKKKNNNKKKYLKKKKYIYIYI